MAHEARPHQKLIGPFTLISHKFIKIDNEIKYILLQLSKNYVTLIDYDQLYFIKNNHHNQ